MIQLIKCFFCSGQVSSKFLLKNFPEAPRVAANPTFNFIDFEIGVCDSCGLIQQMSRPRPAVLYENFKNDVIGYKLSRQKNLFTKFLSAFIRDDDNLFEYGAGNGQIALALAHRNVNITINDFNVTFSEPPPRNIEVIHGAMSDIEFKPKSFDLVYSSHVFEHLNDFGCHLRQMRSILKLNGMYILALPHFESWLRNLNLNTFSQEHPVYPFFHDLKSLFQSNGFEMVEKVEFEDHSLFLAFSYKNDENYLTDPKNYKEELLERYIVQLESLESFLRQTLGAFDQLIFFGANSSTQILLSLVTKCEEAALSKVVVVDNSALKQGSYLYGYEIVVQDPSIIREFGKKDCVILMLGTFDDEVRAQIHELNSEINVFTKDFL